jgi:hypothetical protein
MDGSPLTVITTSARGFSHLSGAPSFSFSLPITQPRLNKLLFRLYGRKSSARCVLIYPALMMYLLLLMDGANDRTRPRRDSQFSEAFRRGEFLRTSITGISVSIWLLRDSRNEL